MASDRFDQPTMLETMGIHQPSTEDNRGSSMVQKHYEKLQQEKENAAMGKLQSLMPQLGSLVRALALQETSWNVEKAVLLLRRFHLANSDTLTHLHKRRKQLLAAASTKRSGTAKVPKAKASDSQQLQGNPSKGNRSYEHSSGGESDSSDAKQHRSRRHQEKSESRKRRKGTKADKKIKKKKRAKKDSADGDKLPAMYQYGRYGIIKESDMYNKRSEFTSWAAEVKKIDSEALPRHEEKELFRDYMEDYNTGTLPHRKYYDLGMYEARKRRKSGGSSQPAKERVAFNDEEELRRQKEHDRLKVQQDRMREAWEELKYTGKAEEMREQELLRMQLALAYKTGDTDQVQKLADRLKPDEQ